MQEAIRSKYESRVQNLQKDLRRMKRQINQIALIRLLVFLGAVIAAFILVEEGYYAITALGVVAVGLIFLYLVKIHAGLKFKKLFLEHKIQVNQEEIQALAGDYSAFVAGEVYETQDHPYAYDLDIFGKDSIFQFLNRTTSAVGEADLADWLRQGEPHSPEIKARQGAVEELSTWLDWRQDFRASGMLIQESLAEKTALLHWLQAPTVMPQTTLFKVLLWVAPILTSLIALLVLLSLIPVQIIYIPILINLAWLGRYSKTLLQHSKQISQRAKVIRKHGSLFQLVEQETFKSPRALELQSYLRSEKYSASASLRQLSSIVENMEQGFSMFGFVFNALFLWSLQYLYKLEKWQIQHQTNVADWFQAIGQMDALLSLANLKYNHPEYVFPEVVAQNFQLEAQAMGHPLLPAQQRVDNPIQLQGWGQLMIITGANMAGKSTYLRTVGVNLVLAMTGAPVCAEQFRFKPIAIYTSMRTKDSLQASESFFYAELKRLRMLIENLSQGKKIFIILDEILKGTNSTDQHLGSKALIEQLVKLEGVGLIATHDLSLGELEKKYPESIYNYCFEIEIQGENLSFDYKLRPGITQNLNATYLMKKMGITV